LPIFLFKLLFDFLDTKAAVFVIVTFYICGKGYNQAITTTHQLLSGVPDMSSTKKPLVYTLIFLLTATALVGVLSPVKATETWTDINLPYTITEAGNYRITSPWNISGVGLSINASDVVVDGQNNLIPVPEEQPVLLYVVVIVVAALAAVAVLVLFRRKSN